MKLLMDRGRMLAELSAAARRDQEKRTDWYAIHNAAGETAEVVIYAEIGWFGKTAQDFMDELRGITAQEISLRVNSPGGEIFDGIAIHNILRAHPAKVTAYVDSLAASIASVIVMAADRIVMMPHSQLMIHDGSGGCWGNAEEMLEMHNLLNLQSDNIAGVYAERAGGQLRSWRNRMKEETWYTAQEAVDAGLADEVGGKRSLKPEEASEDGVSEYEEARLSTALDLSVYAVAGVFKFAGRLYAPAPVASADDDPDEVPDEPEAPAASDEPDTPPADAPADEPDENQPTVTGGEWGDAVAHLTQPPDDWRTLAARLTPAPRLARRPRTAER